jgi:hypothetical protein
MALKVPTNRGNVNMITWLELKEQNVAKGEILTDGLSSLFCISAGSLQKTASTEGIQVEPLLQTSEAGRALDGALMKFMSDPEQLQSDYQASAQSKAQQVWPTRSPASSKAPSRTENRQRNPQGMKKAKRPSPPLRQPIRTKNT